MNVTVPEHWELTEIGELVESMTGGASPHSNDYSQCGVLALNKGDIKPLGKIHLKKLPKRVPHDFADIHANKIIHSGAVLVTLRDLSQKADFLGLIAEYKNREPALITQGMYCLTLRPEIFKQYLIQYSNSAFYRVQVKQEKVGATQVHLRNQQFSELRIPLPPLAEQKVIAAKLDELLAQVDTLKTRLDTIPKILKRFRQSVLAAAVSGRLTEEWRNYSSYNACLTTLSDVIDGAQVGLVRSSSEQEDSSSGADHLPYLKMNNIDNEWGLSISSVVSVKCDSAERERYRLQVGDWLFNTRNSRELVGKSCVWNEAGEYLYNNNILRIRLKDNFLSIYLEIWFRSHLGRSSLERIKSATTSVAAIYQKQLLKQAVPFPNLKEQAEIARRVDQLFANADQIEQQVKSAQARVSRLTQAILAKAFRGELTAEWRAQNPELTSGEDSAEALLTRIRAEREATGQAKKSRKGKQ